jgi:hypothetical protein
MVIFFLGVAVLIVAVTLTNISGARKQHSLEGSHSQEASVRSLHHSHHGELCGGDPRLQHQGMQGQAGGTGRSLSSEGMLPPPSIPSPAMACGSPHRAYPRPPLSPVTMAESSALPPSIPFPSSGGLVYTGAVGTSPGSPSHPFHGVYISASTSLGGFDGLGRGRGASYTYRIPVGATLGH